MYIPLRKKTEPLGNMVYKDLLDDLVMHRRATG